MRYVRTVDPAAELYVSEPRRCSFSFMFKPSRGKPDGYTLDFSKLKLDQIQQIDGQNAVIPGTSGAVLDNGDKPLDKLVLKNIYLPEVKKRADVIAQNICPPK